MTKEEKEFLEKNFKAGEFTVITLLVKNKDMTKMMEALKGANITMAALPRAAAGMAFENPDTDGTSQ